MSNTLTKAEMIEHLIVKLGVKKVEAKKMVESFFEAIASSLEKGEDVKLSGFGNFTVKHKKARPGRNPKTKEDAEISERFVTTFKAGTKLSTRVLNSAL